MSRALTILNALGVLALAALCIVQWQRDRRLHIELTALQQTNHVQFASIVEQSNTLRGVNEDLAQFKQRFTQAHSDVTETRASLRKLERENEQLLAERNQLKASVTNWASAVAERDERLKEITSRAQELATKLNDSILRFNELATNYNGAVRRFDALATNYNNVVGELNQLRSAAKSPQTATK
jgi:chromosome segregation ATPase